MKTEIRIPESVKVGYEMPQLSPSLLALMNTSMFWSQNMDSSKHEHIERRIKRNEEKKERGLWWRRSHSVATEMGIPKSKSNLRKIFESLTRRSS